MELQFTLDNMISNPDILMTAVNETFGTDFQHQYYTPNTPTNSVYMTQPQATAITDAAENKIPSD